MNCNYGREKISVQGNEKNVRLQGEQFGAQAIQIDEEMLASIQSRVDERLRALLPNENASPARLHQAMSRTTLSSGKRFRPLLTILIAEGSPIEIEAVIDLSCTSELVHAASLILDDLPCMDDALTRRNEPCTHIFYDESTAILTATALLNLAFGIIANLKGFSDAQKVQFSALLSNSVGSHGLIAGQMLDLMNTNKANSIENVEHLNALKTGALIDYAVEVGAIAKGCNQQQTEELRHFSNQLGLAFQLMDDLKDRLMSESELQKDANKDVNKATILAMTNEPKAKAMVEEYIAKAKRHLVSAGFSADSKMAALLDLQFAFLKR